MAIGFAIGLAVSATMPAGGAVAPAAPAEISSFAIVSGAAALDPDGGGLGIEANGWVAKVTLPFRAGASLDPGRITLTVSDPGFDASGSVVRTRTIRCGKVLRRQRPNEAALQAGQVGGSFEAYVSLEDDIYAGSTITGVECADGYYGAAEAGAVAAGAIVNTSTLAYPKPLFAWLNIQHERATGTGFAVEAVAYHRHAMLGQQVARVEFIGSDGTNTAATQAATAPALSSFQTQGNIVEAWKATVPLTALTQGLLCSVNAKVYPWIGDSSAVLDLSTDGITWPTARPRTLLRFLNDKTGGYGGAVACVKAGASGGTVQSSLSAARATPFPTINAAIAALPAWNNANKGHNDHSGSTVYLMDDGAGGAVAHAPAAGFTSTAVGQCWTDVRADPANTGAVSVSLSATRGACSLIRWFVNITHTAGNGFDSGVNSGSVLAAYESLTVNASGTVGVNYRQHFSYWRNVTATGSANPPSFVAPSGAIRMQAALILGHIQETIAVDRTWNAYAVIGCRTKRVVLSEQDVATFTAIEAPTNGGVIANNVMRDQRQSQHIARLNAMGEGVAIVQNVFEHANVSGIALQVGADGATQAFDNVLLHHNSIVGDRLNIAYNDVAGSEGVVKRLTSRFNLMAEVNTKSDLFTTSNGGTTNSTGRVGPWRFLHRTGCRGDVSLIGSAAGTAPGVGSWLGEYWPDGEYNVGRSAVGFVNDQGNWQPTGTIGAGSGDYRLTGTVNAAYSNVPSGLAVLAFDLDGNARRNDGLGAAGAYERGS